MFPRCLFSQILNDESQEMIHVVDRQSNRSLRESFQVNICSKLFKHSPKFILGFESGINMNFGFYPSETQTPAYFRMCARDRRVCVCACVCVCVCV